jgi:Holliday junction resolvasome RuvABC DNA-binding subunit
MGSEMKGKDVNETCWSSPSNEEVADLLDRVGDLLQAQEANPFRVRAYQGAARQVRTLEVSVADLFGTEGKEGLEKMPGIGRRLASAILEYVRTGRLRLLDRLEGEIDPEDLFRTIPGVGEKLAHRIHEALGIDTLEEMEEAAHDGRLEKVAGLGRRRIRAVQNELDAVLSRSGRRRARRFRTADAPENRQAPPSVPTILEVDREYRTRAEKGQLKRIAPRRFNPEGKAWLPLWHADREGWNFTVLYSNTALAHRRGKTRDWVVIFYERDGLEGQCTVVTETRGGSLQGRRVIRGRETECKDFYLTENEES